MTIPLASMRGDISGLIDDWGVDVTILRRAGTLDSAGRNSAAFATASTDELWIQPMSESERRRMPAGVVENVSHVAAKRYATFALKKEDRVVSPSEVYQYDVVAVANWPTHSTVYLNLVKRDA